tara:strand:+ start:745 stop:2919 length:2175 start_codon:yes stop_codon:yes gene_type:complete
MFRKEALRKGVLKTINANTGIMVGQPTTPAPVPALRKPPTFFERMSVSGPVRGTKNLIKGGVQIPGVLGYYAGDKVAQGFGIEDPIGRTAFGLGGGYAATRALPALAGIGFLPSVVGLAGLAGLKNRYDAGVELRKKINAMSPQERAEFERMNRIKALEGEAGGFSDADLFGKFVPKPIEEKVAEDRKIIEGRPGSGRPSFNKSKTLKAEGDPLLQDNVANADDIADLDAVQENAVNLDSTGMPPGPPGSTDTLPTKSTKDVADKDMSKDEKKNIEKENTAQGNNEIALGGPSDDVEFNKTIALAKKYQEEVFKNEGSQAGLVFLANLASGLLTGTTRRSGIAGAMEVFGQAIGPAVNNYATIKLKEGELRANNREASLNAALDHMKFVNDNANAEVERPEQTGGIVQIRGADGRLRNYKAYQMKDGTVTMAAGIGADGREMFVPVSQGAPIADSDGKLIGQFENFLQQKNVDKRLFDIQDVLGNRYNALSVTRDVLKTLNQMDESGETVKAGAALSIDQFTRRLSGVAKEVLGFEVSGMSLDALEAKVAELQADEYAAIDRDPDLSDEGKEAAKKNLDSKNLIKQAKARLNKRGMLSGLSREEQEKLAVQEVTLTYALANTFKDQDRLTQRDVNAAKEIVNIFSLTRSSKDVKASIEAIGRQLESDIRRQESLYTTAGGLETTLKDLRKLKNFEVFEGEGGVASQLAEDLSLEEIENIIEGIN